MVIYENHKKGRRKEKTRKLTLAQNCLILLENKRLKFH